MAGKIFVNYRRADTRSDAARIYDRLVATFGKSAVFMDVDNLRAGQRFDSELDKALSRCDVFLSVIGPRWLELLKQRQASGELDLVQVEIAEALKRDVLVIPVIVEHTPMPAAGALPEDIRELVLRQKCSLAHESFGRDMGALIDVIKADGIQIEKPRRVLAVTTGFSSLMVVLFGIGTAQEHSILTGILMLCFGGLGLWAARLHWMGQRFRWGRKKHNA